MSDSQDQCATSPGKSIGCLLDKVTVDDLTELRIKVVDEMYNDWQKLAENLQFTEDCVQHIMQQFVSQWDRCSEVLSLWISHYKGTGEKKRVRRSLYNAVLQAGFPKVAVSLKVSLRDTVTEEDLPDLKWEVVDKIGHRWEAVAQNLKFTVQKVDSIRKEKTTNEDRCEEMLLSWIRNDKGSGDFRRIKFHLYDAILKADSSRVAEVFVKGRQLAEQADTSLPWIKGKVFM